MAVYMIQPLDTHVVKIGKSDNPAKRLNQLQDAHFLKLSIIRLFGGGLKEEARLLRRFAKHRIRGEWFNLVPEMLGDVGLEETTIEAVQADLVGPWTDVPDGYDRRLWRQCVSMWSRGDLDSGETPLDLYSRTAGQLSDAEAKRAPFWSAVQVAGLP